MTHKKEFPRDMSFVDRQGNVVHPSKEDYHLRKSADVGRAYGFFYCNASKQEIETELPTIRELVRTPSQLELSLIEGMDNIRGGIRGDKRLTALARKAKQDGISHMLQATYPGGTNRDTADKVASILNQAYQSPLYEAGEPFKGAIVYEESGEYVFRE